MTGSVPVVRDLMARAPISVSPSTSLAEAAALMLSYRFSGLPVVADGLVVGVISEGDFLRRPEFGTDCVNGTYWAEPFGLDPAERRRRAYGLKVGDAMSRRVVSVTGADSLADAVRLMLYYEIKRLPVVEEGRLVGMLSRSDFLKAFLTVQPVSATAKSSEAARRAGSADFA